MCYKLTVFVALLMMPCFVDASDKPVKVYILSGQSNMVGIGQVTGGGSRWGDQFIDPEVSVYSGAYDSKLDYDSLKPLAILKLESFGGVKPTPYPGGGTHVTRGFVQVKETGVYEFRPGYGGSTVNIMEVDGMEVHRKEPNGKSKFTQFYFIYRSGKCPKLRRSPIRELRLR